MAHPSVDLLSSLHVLFSSLIEAFGSFIQDLLLTAVKRSAFLTGFKDEQKFMAAFLNPGHVIHVYSIVTINDRTTQRCLNIGTVKKFHLGQMEN